MSTQREKSPEEIDFPEKNIKKKSRNEEGYPHIPNEIEPVGIEREWIKCKDRCTEYRRRAISSNSQKEMVCTDPGSYDTAKNNEINEHHIMYPYSDSHAEPWREWCYDHRNISGSREKKVSHLLYFCQVSQVVSKIKCDTANMKKLFWQNNRNTEKRYEKETILFYEMYEEGSHHTFILCVCLSLRIAKKLK